MHSKKYLIANNNIRNVILEIKTTDAKSLKYYFNDFTSVVLLSNLTLLILLFAIKLSVRLLFSLKNITLLFPKTSVLLFLAMLSLCT